MRFAGFSTPKGNGGGWFHGPRSRPVCGDVSGVLPVRWFSISRFRSRFRGCLRRFAGFSTPGCAACERARTGAPSGHARGAPRASGHARGRPRGAETSESPETSSKSAPKARGVEYANRRERARATPFCRPPLGVLKPAHRLRHPPKLLRKGEMLSTQTGKPPETFPQSGREWTLANTLAAPPWGAETSASLETSSPSALKAEVPGQPNRQTA